MRRPWLLALVLASAAAPARADEPAPWLGIGLDNRMGPEVAVTEVYPGTAAARAGLQPGDLVVAIDGSPLMGSSDLVTRVRSRAVGDRLRLTVVRDGDLDVRVTTVRLGARPSTSELLEARLVGTAVPALDLLEPRGPLGLGPRTQVLVAFHARCDTCGPVADALAAAVVDDGLALPVRALVVGDPDAVGQYLRRVPLMTPVTRVPDEGDATAGRWLLSGVASADEGVVLVVDGKGVVQFAASTALGPDVTAAALAAAARADHGRGRRR